MDSKSIINHLIVLAICAPILIIIPYYTNSTLIKILFVYLISTAIAIIWFLNRKGNSISSYSEDKIIMCYLLIVILSTIFSLDLVRSIWGIPRREEGLFAIIVYIFLFIIVNKKYKFSNNHVIFFLISASIVALYGIAQYLGYDPIPRNYINMYWKGRAFSTMGNPNFLGSYLTLVLPIGVFSYVYSKKVGYLVASGIIYFCLLCTMTRSAWLGSLVSFFILIYYTYKRKYSYKHIAIIILSFALITLLFDFYSHGAVFGRFFSIYKDIGKVITQSSGYENAGANRIFIWKRVIELIKKRPLFGYGLETLDIVFTEAYRDEIIAFCKRLIIFDKAHNEYLHIAVSTGIPSLIVYLTFVGSILYKAFKNVKNNPLIIPLLCSIIGYLVQAFFNISVVSVAYIYWMFLGALLKFSYESESKSETAKQ